jgi:NTE family protein
VTGADLIVGTSAGATAAAQITGADLARLLTATLAEAPRQRPAAAVSEQASGPGYHVGPAQPVRPAHPIRPVVNHLDRITKIIAASANPTDLRRRLGASSLELDAAADGTWQSQWRATVASRLPQPHWPERQMLITAVDAHTGHPVEFHRDNGVDLVDAVAASCSSTLPYRIGDHAYIDGGHRRSAENADLALGYDRVLVLSPLGGRTLAPPAWGLGLATQVEELRAAGSRVETVFPAGDDEHLFGANAMNPSLRPLAARAGHDQGLALAELLAEHWR